jgi:hypothetical protein
VTRGSPIYTKRVVAQFVNVRLPNLHQTCGSPICKRAVAQFEAQCKFPREQEECVRTMFDRLWVASLGPHPWTLMGSSKRICMCSDLCSPCCCPSPSERARACMHSTSMHA